MPAALQGEVEGAQGEDVRVALEYDVSEVAENDTAAGVPAPVLCEVFAEEDVAVEVHEIVCVMCVGRRKGDEVSWANMFRMPDLNASVMNCGGVGTRKNAKQNKWF